MPDGSGSYLCVCTFVGRHIYERKFHRQEKYMERHKMSVGIGHGSGHQNVDCHSVE